MPTVDRSLRGCLRGCAPLDSPFAAVPGPAAAHARRIYGPPPHPRPRPQIRPPGQVLLPAGGDPVWSGHHRQGTAKLGRPRGRYGQGD
eukprot:391051-Prorocentrum_minimum.AAC.1